MTAKRREEMSNFIVACITAVVLAAIGAVALNVIQEPVSVAFTEPGVRL
jgi:hypothetical protein